MLTIQKFAQLAGTTRRTLIFYDEKDLFKPKTVAANGYRYYEYNQLYQLSFILELRQLGLSIAEIKSLDMATDAHSLNRSLHQVLTQIDQKMARLSQLKATLTTRFSQVAPPAVPTQNQPFIMTGHLAHFCRSTQSVSCTEAEVAQIYAEFYQQLGQLKLVNRQDSGFLTQLPNSDASAYPTASFCLLKAVAADTDTGDLPRLEKPAGQYVAINTTNQPDAICHSLTILRDYIQQQHLTITDQLWQMNLDEAFTSKGASDLVCLQYQLTD
ncbi:MerR family transcriptional regulator [Levilactobacillus angrenensis]|uniref:MerR family transcriptional regulator n=1 Tax=Levilactobacillus angrenensis TaxID=2486020 RepID=A0ABW1U899_9LACO|nr:MerR family transcriptional regulator [Levilactobacillus angrenensis]